MPIVLRKRDNQSVIGTKCCRIQNHNCIVSVFCHNLCVSVLVFILCVEKKKEETFGEILQLYYLLKEFEEIIEISSRLKRKKIGKMSRQPDEASLNTSVIDTSSFRADDFALFMDCLENIGATADKKKKQRKYRSRAQRVVKAVEAGAVLNKTTGCDLGGKRWAPSHFSSCYNLSDAPDHNTLNISCSTINHTINDDIDASVVSEKFNLNDVFAYFEEDFDKTRFEDSDSNDDSAKLIEGEKENAAKNAPKEKLVRSARPKRVGHEAKSKTMLATIPSSSESERETSMFKRPTALPLARKIIAAAKKPDAKLVTSNDAAAAAEKPDAKLLMGNDVADNRLSRTVDDARVKQPQRYSSASTLSLHESDSDSVAKKTTATGDANSYVAPSVRDKISFFNQTVSECSSSPVPPAAPSTPATSEDDEFQFQRQKSRRKFQQKREFFEKIFSQRFAGGQQPSDRRSNAPTSKALTQEQNINKLEAVETYVQTKYLLDRIQFLIKAITNMDEAQLNKIDLRKMKKFLLFIRDCAYNCQQVCFEISENFLTDFEKNVMSAEELLFTALKAVHMQQKVDENVSVSCVGEMCKFSAPSIKSQQIEINR